jgi:predicted DNA binding protein
MEIVDEEILNILTPKQLEATITAVNSGYYNSPRSVTLNELSELSGVSRSTLQEHLTKAEASLMKFVAKMQNVE